MSDIGNLNIKSAKVEAKALGFNKYLGGKYHYSPAYSKSRTEWDNRKRLERSGALEDSYMSASNHPSNRIWYSGSGKFLMIAIGKDSFGGFQQSACYFKK